MVCERERKRELSAASDVYFWSICGPLNGFLPHVEDRELEPCPRYLHGQAGRCCFLLFYYLSLNSKLLHLFSLN